MLRFVRLAGERMSGAICASYFLISVEPQLTLLPPGEGARRADEGAFASRHQPSALARIPHPALRATFSQEEKDAKAATAEVQR